jgi:pimeloyl-ACP methyl ester carboxylesterase
VNRANRAKVELHRIATSLGELGVMVEGTGPAAVLWHSMLVDDRSWDAIAPTLAQSRRLVRITGPGHGESAPIRRRFTLEECAVATADILDYLGIKGPVDWVGNAWGGHVGIVLAAIRPDLIGSLVALNAPIPALTRGEAIQMRALAIAVRVLGPIGFVRGLVAGGMLSGATRAGRPDVVAYLDDCLVRADRRSLAEAIDSISIHRQSLAPLLQRISAPVCFVTSHADRFWSSAQAEVAASTMANARVETVDGAGHVTPLEAPETTITLVTGFWASAVAIGTSSRTICSRQ